jgi:hypothetical protein
MTVIMWQMVADGGRWWYVAGGELRWHSDRPTQQNAAVQAQTVPQPRIFGCRGVANQLPNSG